ncbi:hypothetical protein GCM10011371_05810 [Novosphingobium marinum]|uniref:Uncharacterized protein n=1 Tax=Novosphingobium marinum TaxID=1514948 RepID=A0A7Y9XTI8_9SPHN|nr:hypothetical protein [Novosphingobium marinum]NYH94269.1 hypothetical protein [Novosphingobium marinum]GGC20992.1 hypothetical protein GCM10011371_05810 [Novosphingobium marinum]
MRRISGLFAACSLAIAGTAHAAEPPCLTPAEFSSLAGYSMPSVIKGTSQRCASALSADAYLRTNGDELAARYAKRKPVSWPGAKKAFLKLSADTNQDANDLLSRMPDESMKQMLDAVIEGMVSSEIPLERCKTIDRFVRLLSPLPAENTAELIALAVGLGSKSEKAKVGKIAICPS